MLPKERIINVGSPTCNHRDASLKVLRRWCGLIHREIQVAHRWICACGRVVEEPADTDIWEACQSGDVERARFLYQQRYAADHDLLTPEERSLAPVFHAPGGAPFRARVYEHSNAAGVRWFMVHVYNVEGFHLGEALAPEGMELTSELTPEVAVQTYEQVLREYTR